MLHHCYRKCCSVVTKNDALEITENAAFLITVHIILIESIMIIVEG